jgi:uncharacterized protein
MNLRFLFYFMKAWFVILAMNIVTISVFAMGESVAQPELKTQSLILGGHTLVVEMAIQPQEQMRGLMFRKSLGEGRGMLFVYENEFPLSFWMKNTFIPLSIGFFNKNRELINVVDMAPVTSEMQQQLPSYKSARPAKYALEVNQGWFKKNNILTGSKFELRPHINKK